jgi:hypothetical protein
LQQQPLEHSTRTRQQLVYQPPRSAQIITSRANMAAEHAEEELLDYEEDEVEAGGEGKAAADGQKKGYVGIHSTSFKDFLLKVRRERPVTWMTARAPGGRAGAGLPRGSRAVI